MTKRMAILVLSTVLVAGCSSSSNGNGNSPAGTYSFCGAMFPQCAPDYTPMPTACSQTAAQQCSTLQAQFSDGYRNAVIACAKDFSPCTEDFVTCIGNASLSPTPAQAKVKADFCAWCPDQANEKVCSTFFTEPPDGGGAAGIYYAGNAVLKVNDTVAAQMDKCVGSSLIDAGTSADGGVPPCDVLAFASCTQNILNSATTPSACHDGG